MFFFFYLSFQRDVQLTAGKQDRCALTHVTTIETQKATYGLLPQPCQLVLGVFYLTAVGNRFEGHSAGLKQRGYWQQQGTESTFNPLCH